MLALDGNGFELARAGEGVEDVAHTRAGGEWRKEGLDLVFGSEDGLTEIEGDEGRERGGLAGVGTGLDLLGEAGGDGLPEGWLIAGLRNGKDAELLPELGERAEDGSLGDFLAQISDQIVRSLRTIFDEQSVSISGERRNLHSAGGGGWLLPRLVAAQGKDEGKGGSRDDEVRSFGRSGGEAEKIERDRGAIGDEACEKGAGGLGGGERGVRVGGA